MSNDLGSAAERSHKHLEELQLELEYINFQKVEIERQREILRLAALNRLKQYKSIEKKLFEEAEAYCKAWGQEFGHTLRTKLPRELRDLVYSHLVVPPDPIRIRKTSELPDHDEWKEAGEDTFTWKYANWITEAPKLYRTFAALEYMGIEVGREAVQIFYEKNIFCLSALLESLDLHFFLTNDIFHGDQIPGELVRKIHIQVDDSVMVHNWNWAATRLTNDAAWPTDPTGQYKEPAPLPQSEATALDNLALMKNKKRVEIELHLRTGRKYVRHPLLVNLGSIVFKLRDEGFKVKVLQEERGKKQRTIGKLNGEDVYARPGMDWTFLFEGPKDEWIEKARSKKLYVPAR